MDIDDYGPGFQVDGGDNGLAATETLNTTADDDNDGENQQEREEEEQEEEQQDTRPTSPIQSADIAQLPITQPIPYGGTLPDALNNTVSVQGEAMYEEEEEEEEEEELSPERARATVAAMLAEREQHQPLQITQPQEQQHADEEGEHEGQEKPEHLLSPSARNWIKGVFAKFGRTTKRTASPAPVGGSGNNKKHAPGFGGLPTGDNGANFSGGPTTNAANAGWRVDSQGLQPTQAMPQSTSKDTNNDDNNLNNTQEAVQGVEYGMNPRDQHLATSIDARLDAGGVLGGGGEGAASPMRPPRPFHQPSSVEAIDMEEEEDVEEGGVVDEGAPGVRTRSGLFRNNVAGGGGGGLVQRASSSVDQTGAAAAAANGIPSLGGARNNIINTFSAAIGGFGGPLTQDFYGVTATQEDIEVFLGAGGGSAEDAGNALNPATTGLAVVGREASIPPAEPSRGPGNATLKGRDLSKNAARTTGGMDKNHESEGNGNEDGEEHGQEGGLLEGEVQTSPEKPAAAAAAAAVGRITRCRAAEEMSGDLGGGGSRLQGIEYSKKRKTNPTKIVVKRTTRAAALLEEEEAVAVAATTGSTGVSDEDKEDNDEDRMMHDFGGGGGYHDASMPPPPMVNNIPELVGAREMPTPRGPTPAAQLPGRTLAAREKLHALIRQRQIMSASPSAADNGAGAGGGVPQPAGVYAHPAAAAGGLRVAVQRAAVASGGGSGHNSVDYRTPMAGQTPVHSTLAPGGGLGATRVMRRAYLGPQQRRQQPQPSAASGGGGAAKSSLSSLLGL
jgi:hypothetical protein